MVGAEEILKLAEELIVLSNLPKLNREQQKRAHEIMKVLKENGFTSEMISRVSGGKWGSSTVRKYGGAAVIVETSGRDDLMGLLREFAAGGGRVSDLRDYRRVRERVEASGFKSFNDLLGTLDRVNEAGGPHMLGQLADDLAEAGGLSVKEVQLDIKTRRSLDEKGLTQILQREILETCANYAAKDFLEAMRNYENIMELKGLKERLMLEVEQAKKLVSVEKENLEKAVAGSIGGKESIANMNSLIAYGYTPYTFYFLKILTEKLGSKDAVLQAINEYESLQKLSTINSDLKQKNQNLKEQIEINEPLAKQYRIMAERAVDQSALIQYINSMYINCVAYMYYVDLTTNTAVSMVNPEDVYEIWWRLAYASELYFKNKGPQHKKNAAFFEKLRSDMSILLNPSTAPVTVAKMDDLMKKFQAINNGNTAK